MKKDKEKKEREREFIKSEVNLIEKPFYALDKNRFKRIKYEYEEIINSNGENKIIKISWEVAPEIKMGLPTVFDMKVLRIIEMFIYRNLKKNGRIINPLNIGSLYKFCEILGIDRGGNYKLIKEAIERLSLTGFITKNSYYSKNNKQHLSKASFHLFDQVWKGKELKNGEIADSNYIYIAPLYKMSIENHYIKLLDFTYIKSLNNNIAIRLYEILGIKFYGIKNKNFDFIKYSYEKLCKILPIKEQKYLSDIKRQLKPALKELRKTKFLEKYIFEKRKNKLFIKFYPGEKYFEEVKLDAKSKMEEIKAILNLKEHFLIANKFKISKSEPRSFNLKKRADACYKERKGDCVVEGTIRLHSYCGYCKKLKKRKK